MPLRFGRFLGNTVSQAGGVAVGGATARSLDPFLQDLTNARWAAHPAVPLDPFLIAEGVASGEIPLKWAEDEAERTGINGDRFGRMVDVADSGPGVAEAFTLWRRGAINEAGFRRAAKRALLEDEWIDALVKIHDTLLSSAELAAMQQQGFVDAARANSEGALQGVTAERQQLRFEAAGLPPGAEVAQAARNRGLVDEATFAQMIREGHTKTKYTDLLDAMRHPVLNASTYATLYLKGWISEAEMDAGGALHGYTHEQMHDLYLAGGRPAAPGQMATAAARGLNGPDGRPMDKEQFLKGIRQSDIRPEWGEMLWDARFLYPPLFQISRLVTAGTIDVDTAADWATKDRYPPEVVAKLREAWSQAPSTKADPHVTKAENALYTTLHRSYVTGESDEKVARDKLTTLDVPATAQATIIKLWNEERELIRRQLSPSQVKKAFQKLVVHPATGEPWTRDDALAELLARGYNIDDANAFLDQ